MKHTSIRRWLLLIVFLSGCTGTLQPQVNETAISNEHAAVTHTPSLSPTTAPTATTTAIPSPWSTDPHPLQIEEMRQRSHPDSPIIVEQTLASGANFNQYVVSYQSEGYKIYALMTVPNGEKPDTGWPVIIFNHGYIAPSEYRTTERYVAYVNAIAQHGYIVFKPDFRGHGSSDGAEVEGGGYGTPGYTDDILNTIASLKAYEDADPDRIGMWGHSMGGQVTLRAMVVSKDIKAGVIWGGVVAPYPDIIARWDYTKNPRLFPGLVVSELTSARSSSSNWLQNFSDWVKEFSTKYGEPEQNPDFWVTISPNSYLADLSGPLQLHHSTTDEMVPLAWSETLAGELQAAAIPYEFYTYPGDNHNISENFGVAMQRTLAFFDAYVKP
jgi:dienelactone hydrolase